MAKIEIKNRGRMVAEFLLIVIGVLVALAVETALESREDDQLRDDYIARLKTDIAADRDSVENRIEFFADVQRFSNEVLLWTQTEQLVDQKLLLASFYAAEIWPFVPNLSTYDDLRNTGNIRLIDDIDLRMGLSAYYNKADTSRSGWNPSEDFREVVRGIIPNGVQDLIREKCPTTDELDEEPTGFPACALPGVDYDELSRLFEPLKTDVEFRRILTYRHSELGVMIYLLNQQVVFADVVLAQIEQQ
jgi:hypothetical protein